MVSNDLAMLMRSPAFRGVMAELLVGLNLFDSAHGNAFNDGIRFAAKWIFDGIMLNGQVEKERKELFMKELGRLYVKEKTEEHGDGNGNAWNVWDVGAAADGGGTGE